MLAAIYPILYHDSSVIAFGTVMRSLCILVYQMYYYLCTIAIVRRGSFHIGIPRALSTVVLSEHTHQRAYTR